MGVSHRYLTKVEVQHLLGVTTFGMGRLTRKYDKFPRPDERPYSPFNRDRQEPEEAWDATEVYPCAAQTAEFTHRGAVLLRPAPENPAPGGWLGYRDTLRGSALDWHTDIGVIRLVHCDDSKTATHVASAIASNDKKESVVTVCALYGDMGFGGPRWWPPTPRSRALSTRRMGRCRRLRRPDDALVARPTAPSESHPGVEARRPGGRGRGPGERQREDPAPGRGQRSFRRHLTGGRDGHGQQHP